MKSSLAISWNAAKNFPLFLTYPNQLGSQHGVRKSAQSCYISTSHNNREQVYFSLYSHGKQKSSCKLTEVKSSEIRLTHELGIEQLSLFLDVKRKYQPITVINYRSEGLSLDSVALSHEIERKRFVACQMALTVSEGERFE